MKNKIIIIGDIILDRYLICTKTKDNPEKDFGFVWLNEKIDNKLGGAAAVALLCKKFGSQVFLTGAVGNDKSNNIIQDLLNNYDIESGLLISKNKTTVKTRILVDNNLFPNRIDSENTQHIFGIESKLPKLINMYNVILLQDYGKGVCTTKLINLLHSFNIPIIVDPCIDRDWNDYGKVELIKCNLKESKRLCYFYKPLDILKYLHYKYKVKIIITDGENGMYWIDNNKNFGHVKAIKTNIVDSCGAGDTVLATIGVLYGKYSLGKICELCTITASRQIESIGINPVDFS